MDSNFIAASKELNNFPAIEPSFAEKNIENYLERTTPRETNLFTSAKTFINNLHPKGIVHVDKDFGDSVKQIRSEVVEDIGRYFRETDSDASKDRNESHHSSQTLTDEYTRLIRENEKLKRDLAMKEVDISTLGPRYKYMEKHFEDFIRMKEDYERLKQDKLQQSKIIETKNKAQQTWATSIVCGSCVKTLEIVESEDFQYFVSSRRDGSYCITKTELMELEDKFKDLKETITEREREYENRFEKAEIIHLTALNCKYRNQLQDLQKKNKQNQNWANALQRIIAKLYASEDLGDLTDQEQGWIDRIVEKYLSFEEVTKQPALSVTDGQKNVTGSDHSSEDRS